MSTDVSKVFHFQNRRLVTVKWLPLWVPSSPPFPPDSGGFERISTCHQETTCVFQHKRLTKMNVLILLAVWSEWTLLKGCFDVQCFLSWCRRWCYCWCFLFCKAFLHLGVMVIEDKADTFNTLFSQKFLLNLKTPTITTTTHNNNNNNNNNLTLYSADRPKRSILYLVSRDVL